MMQALAQWWCQTVHGHNFVWEHDERKQWLRCVSCWKETPGLDHAPSKSIARTLRFQARLRRDYGR
jgi:hypothetical protein